MTEIVQYQPSATTDLGAQMDYAKAVASASMLPENYRGKPADIMLAVGLGQSMGLSPAESLYRISVIKGKPTASAELIAANVRKAGHRLRVRGDETTCTATIIRADDPDFEFTVTRDMQWAKSMKLDGNDNYRKQPGTMLQWRAITAVARLACPEALYGVAYTSDELSDGGTFAEPPRASSGLGAALGAMQDVAPQVTAEQIQPEPAPEPEPASITKAQLTKLHTCLTKVGLDDRDQALAYYARVTGRDVESSKALTKQEATWVIEDLQAAERGEPNKLDSQPADDPATADDPTLAADWQGGQA